MTLRSRLFASVALPFLSAAMVGHPVHAANDVRSFEVAQASDSEQQPEVAPEEQPQAEQAEEQPQAEQPQAEQPPVEEAQPQQAPEPEQAAPAPAEPQAADEQPPVQAETPAEQPAEAAPPQPEQPAEEPPAEAPQEPQAVEPQQEQAPAPEEPAAPAEEAPATDEQPQAEQAAPEAAPAQSQTEVAPTPEEKPQVPTKKRRQRSQDGESQQEQAPAASPEGQQPADQQQPADTTAPSDAGQPAAEQPQSDEAAPAPDQPQPEQQPATDQSGETAPADGATDQQTEAAPIVDQRSVEENQAIAADPSKTDETVVLPVTGGAAVLDSDKEADNRGGQTSREERRRQREAQRQEQAAPPPKSDAEAQAAAPEVDPAQVRQQIEEKGQRIDEAPQFALPGAAAAGQPAGNADNNGGTTVNNTTTNNVTNNTVNNVVVVQQNDNRAVLRVDDQLVVRSDDRQRLRRDAEDSYYERLPRGRYRETIERPNGVRLVTVYNRYGDVIQRSRIGRDGHEHLLVYAPEAADERPPIIRDVGNDLPPMRLRIPLDDYIIDTSSEPDRDYYDFLAEPPVERVERTYSLDEVKYSARLRDKVRRIDLDTITFATGSAEVPMSQARSMRRVAAAMQKLLDRDPGETFLIEGHTDAVGSDQSNLVLSDKRADSVASLLTEVYDIPPENLATQGYGERYLKIRTQSAEQQNRRVTIRRVTPLVRPVAKAQ